MTLFDGEADEIEARRARAHLLICQSCANRWLDWNRSRDLLRLAPVPAPPPQLLWRVLIACRLVGAPRRAAERAASSSSATSPAASNFPQVAAPANFSAQILARTTRAKLEGNTASTMAAQSSKRPFWRAGFPLRMAVSPLKMSALALPALAAWMMVLQRDIWLPDIWLTAPNSVTGAGSPRAFTARRGAAHSPAAAMAPRVGRRTAPDLAASSAENAPSAPVTTGDFASETLAAPSDFAASRPISRSRAVPVTAMPSAPVMRAIEASFGLRAGADFERAAPPQSWDESQNEASEAAASEMAEVRRAPHRAARVHPAALSNPQNAPRLRATRWQKAPVLSASPDANGASIRDGAGALQPLRVSLPSARVPQPARLIADNFDANDERVDEIRSVVDDFRATLGPDDAGAESAPGDGDGLG